MKTQITREFGSLLIELARRTIEKKFSNAELNIKELEKQLADIAKEKRGTFVTLTKKGHLRGCIGNIEPVKSLLESVIDNAEHAAFRDTRFSPLSADELKDVEIEISILTPTVSLDYKNGEDLITKIRPGIDGVILKKGYQSATFLPQVWEQLKEPEQFLSHLCVKAGFSSDAWTKGDLDVRVYQVQSFEAQQKDTKQKG